MARPSPETHRKAQRALQAKHVAAGTCRHCDEPPVNAGMCEAHYESHLAGKRTRYRKAKGKRGKVRAYRKPPLPGMQWTLIGTSHALALAVGDHARLIGCIIREVSSDGIAFRWTLNGAGSGVAGSLRAAKLAVKNRLKRLVGKVGTIPPAATAP